MENAYQNQVKELNLCDNIDADIYLTQLSNETTSYLKYAKECILESPIITGEEIKDSDHQIITLRGYVLMIEAPIIFEIGCGAGRTLTMFRSMDPDVLSTITYIGTDIKWENLDKARQYANSIGLVEKGLNFSIINSCEYKEVNSVDMCIFANVIHEIKPTELCSELNKYLRMIKPKGKAVILECVELITGEREHVMLYKDAIKALFKEEQKKGSLNIAIDNPHSHKGRPLMNVVITINNPQNIDINEQDVIQALNAVIKSDSLSLKNHFNESNKLSPISLAFKAHNLAHAQMFKDIILEKSII